MQSGPYSLIRHPPRRQGEDSDVGTEPDAALSLSTYCRTFLTRCRAIGGLPLSDDIRSLENLLAIEVWRARRPAGIVGAFASQSSCPSRDITPPDTVPSPRQLSSRS